MDGWFRRIIHNDIYLVVINIILLAGLLGALTFLTRNQHEVVVEEQKDIVKEFVYSGYRVVEFYYQKAKTKELTEPEAKARALSMLKVLSYGDHRYYFVFTVDGTIMLHPQMPAGYDVAADKYSQATYPLVRDAAVNSFDGGFTIHSWPRPSTGMEEQKLTFSRYFQPWDWVIGSGAFIGDIGSRHTGEVITVLTSVVLTSTFVGLILFTFVFITYLRRCPLCKKQNEFACKFVHPGDN